MDYTRALVRRRNISLVGAQDQVETPPERAERVEPAAPPPAPYADLAAGTGLRGLVDRVEALDGRLAVESEPGGGTKVRAEIPLASGS